MFWKMCVTVALYLILSAAASEGFFLSASMRKQAPPATSFNAPQWMPPSTTGNYNSGANGGQSAYGNFKEYGPYQQQQQQQQQSQSQQLQQPSQNHHQQQQLPQYYTSQLQNVQMTGPKYEAIPNHQFLNQQQLYAYEAGYGSYPQSVQLVPCLCPVNKEIMEQQQQQQQQQQQSSLQSSPTSGENGSGGLSSSSAQGNQKLNS